LSRPAVAGLRWNRREIAGGLGDAGLLIPIAIAMVTVNGLNATAVFAGVGLAYIGTALYFRVPVPVQPLKAFAGPPRPTPSFGCFLGAWLGSGGPP
jgi:hypothetical protein